jgi:hypothetical protein
MSRDHGNPRELAAPPCNFFSTAPMHEPARFVRTSQHGLFEGYASDGAPRSNRVLIRALANLPERHRQSSGTKRDLNFARLGTLSNMLIDPTWSAHSARRSSMLLDMCPSFIDALTAG